MNIYPAHLRSNSPSSSILCFSLVEALTSDNPRSSVLNSLLNLAVVLMSLISSSAFLSLLNPSSVISTPTIVATCRKSNSVYRSDLLMALSSNHATIFLCLPLPPGTHLIWSQKGPNCCHMVLRVYFWGRNPNFCCFSCIPPHSQSLDRLFVALQISWHKQMGYQRGTAKRILLLLRDIIFLYYENLGVTEGAPSKVFVSLSRPQ